MMTKYRHLIAQARYIENTIQRARVSHCLGLLFLFLQLSTFKVSGIYKRS